jgi:hypothetical protein
LHTGLKDAIIGWPRVLMRLSENAHLPFDKLMALSRVEGLHYPYPPPC